jgi:hypothetical protein
MQMHSGEEQLVRGQDNALMSDADIAHVAPGRAA